MDNYNVGARIRALRAERRISQEQLALGAGITPAYLGQIERGERNPTVGVIEKVCFVLSMSVGEFFNDAKDMPQQDAYDAQIMLYIRNLPITEKKEVAAIIRHILNIKENQKP